MTTSNCPYCGESAFTAVSNTVATRKRHPLHTVVQCNACTGYAVRMRGSVYPLHDRTSANADAITKVVDEV